MRREQAGTVALRPGLEAKLLLFLAEWESRLEMNPPPLSSSGEEGGKEGEGEEVGVDKGGLEDDSDRKRSGAEQDGKRDTEFVLPWTLTRPTRSCLCLCAAIFTRELERTWDDRGWVSERRVHFFLQSSSGDERKGSARTARRMRKVEHKAALVNEDEETNGTLSGAPARGG